ncbi:hypothetical protein, partial [Mycobacterium tuberculosis]
MPARFALFVVGSGFFGLPLAARVAPPLAPLRGSLAGLLAEPIGSVVL